MTILINLIVTIGCWFDERGENDTRGYLGLWWLPLDHSLTIYAEQLSLFHLFANFPIPPVSHFSFRRNYYKFCLWLQTTGLLHLMHNIFVVINSVKSFRQTVNARGLGMVEMHEGLDHLRSVVVVPNSAPGVCAKTNAWEDTLVGPTCVVTTINFVAHGFDSAKNKKRTVLATFSVPEAAIVLFSAKDLLALTKRIVASTNKNDAKQSSCQSRLEFFISMVSSRWPKSQKYETGFEGDRSTPL